MFFSENVHTVLSTPREKRITQPTKTCSRVCWIEQMCSCFPQWAEQEVSSWGYRLLSVSVSRGPGMPTDPYARPVCLKSHTSRREPGHVHEGEWPRSSEPVAHKDVASDTKGRTVQTSAELPLNQDEEKRRNNVLTTIQSEMLSDKKVTDRAKKKTCSALFGILFCTLYLLELRGSVWQGFSWNHS